MTPDNFFLIAWNNVWLYGIVFILVLDFVVLIHEAGHYLAARTLGIRVENFSIGLGREIFGRTNKSGCRWSIRMIPFGGYIRTHGAYPDEIGLLREQAFCYRPFYQKLIVAMAGPAFNIVLGILALVFLYTTIGRPSSLPYIAALETHAPAQMAGMKIGDIVTKVDGKKTPGIEDVKSALANKIGKAVSVEALRGNNVLYFSIRPKALKETGHYGNIYYRGILGAIWPNYGLDINEIYEIEGVNTRGDPDKAREVLIKHFDKLAVIKFGDVDTQHMVVFITAAANTALKDSASKDYNSLTIGPRPTDDMRKDDIFPAAKEAFRISFKKLDQTLGIIFQVITRKKDTTELGGVIKISNMTAKMAKQGTFIFISFVALLSVNIGVVNLLPFPGLDGGNILIYAYEGMTKKPLSLASRAYVYGVSLIFLIIVGFIINVGDLIELAGK